MPKGHRPLWGHCPKITMKLRAQNRHTLLRRHLRRLTWRHLRCRHFWRHLRCRHTWRRHLRRHLRRRNSRRHLRCRHFWRQLRHQNTKRAPHPKNPPSPLLTGRNQRATQTQRPVKTGRFRYVSNNPENLEATSQGRDNAPLAFVFCGVLHSFLG